MPAWQVIAHKAYSGGRLTVYCLLFVRLQGIQIRRFSLSALLNRELLINISKALCIQGNPINLIEQKS